MNDLLLGSTAQLDNTVQLPSAGSKKPNPTPILDQGIANQFVYVCVSRYETHRDYIEAVYRTEAAALDWLKSEVGPDAYIDKDEYEGKATWEAATYQGEFKVHRMVLK